jgi:hypothetical protein
MKTITHEELMHLSLTERMKALQLQNKGMLIITDPLPPAKERPRYED